MEMPLVPFEPVHVEDQILNEGEAEGPYGPFSMPQLVSL
jgi:hypothetical protein